MRWWACAAIASCCACGGTPAAPDAAPDAIPYPAFSPGIPFVVSGGGKVLGALHVVPVFFGADPEQPAIVDFLHKLAASPAWDAMVGEYHVGELTVGDPVDVDLPVGAQSQADIEAYLAAQLDGTHPEWGPTDPTTFSTAVYVLYYPSTTMITLTNGAQSCSQFGGYHAFVVGRSQYAVIARCPDPSFTELQYLTAVTSHELVETATDPKADAYGRLEFRWFDWLYAMSGAEIGDMCQRWPTSYYTPPDIGYMIQRSWSNNSAGASHAPCVPIPPEESVYFNAVPVLLDRTTSGFEAALIQHGAPVTVDVQLFSDGPTSHSWTVDAIDSGGVLSFAFDRQTGSNGDTLHLTISANTQQSIYETFLLTSTLGTTTTVWVGGVAIEP